MKKIISLLLGLAICLWAADFWLTKPYTDWSEKDIQKIETNSPWSKQVPLTLGGGGGGPDTGRSRRGGSSSGGDLDSTVGSGSTGSGGRGNTQEVGGGAIPGGGASMSITVSWRSALAVREAVAKEKFGAEAATSADAKKIIEDDLKVYLVMISGLPGRALHGNDKMKESLLQSTSLIVKGKDPIQATDVQTGGNEQRPVVLFIFPKTAPLSLDDKDVEFSTKLGTIVVKQKFHLKDMMFNGKLDL
jgi:hypothetical protein